jgi:hypothetical protein
MRKLTLLGGLSFYISSSHLIDFPSLACTLKMESFSEVSPDSSVDRHVDSEGSVYAILCCTYNGT